MDELEKIEVLRDRLGVSYAEAKQALDSSGGDLIAALIALEQKKQKQDLFNNRLEERGREVVDRAKEWLAKTNLTRVKLKKGEHTVLEVPATVGLAGVVAVLFNTPLAIVGALGSVAAMANDYHLEIERPKQE